MAERQLYTLDVTGSSPVPPTSTKDFSEFPAKAQRAQMKKKNIGVLRVSAVNLRRRRRADKRSRVFANRKIRDC